MAALVPSRANLRRVLGKLAASLDCGLNANGATSSSYWASNSNENRLSSHGFNVSRPFSDGRPRGPLWRGRKLIGKEALFVIQELKRAKDDSKRLANFMKTRVSRLLKADLLAVLTELERQDEVFLALQIYKAVKQEVWYKPDMYLFKDMIIVLARNKKMEEAMQLWKEMRKENLQPDIRTYAEVIRGFLRYGSPSDAMNIYEEMKQSPEPPEELPFRVLLKVAECIWSEQPTKIFIICGAWLYFGFNCELEELIFCMKPCTDIFNLQGLLQKSKKIFPVLLRCISGSPTYWCHAEDQYLVYCVMNLCDIC